MIQIKNKLSKFAALILAGIIMAGFNNKTFVFDGGTISNIRVFVSPNTVPAAIEASNASGCAGTITYQWQQSPDGYNFVDIPNATGVSYKPTIINTTTYLRRKAICSIGGVAYTNVLSIIVVPPAVSMAAGISGHEIRG